MYNLELFSIRSTFIKHRNMDIAFKNTFIEKWATYFNNAELPLACYYTGQADKNAVQPPAKGWSCLICELNKARNGTTLIYDKASLGCGGSQRYLGYTDKLRPDFEYFLSCGIPGKIEGERYIKTPEMVKKILKDQLHLAKEDQFIVFKRFDMLQENELPEIIIFFATPDVLSGLFTLANFDQTERDSTIAPFGAGCSSIVHFPYLEKDKERPRAVLGMFDPSARICVGPDILSFAVPIKKFEKMAGHMDESFLITESWKRVRKRIA